jgi:hypothetical protein
MIIFWGNIIEGKYVSITRTAMSIINSESLDKILVMTFIAFSGEQGFSLIRDCGRAFNTIYLTQV